jgi:amidase/6-aminohexanoate-cyclic-dimer hydrolase
MNEDEYLSYDALGLAELISQKEITPRELLECAEKRYRSHNPVLNAVVTPMWDQANEAIEDGLPKGAFSGVPMPLKDLGQHYKGVVTSNGARLFADNVSDHDSTLVERYKAAGLVLSSKTNTPEFGLATTTEPVLHGASRNPWSPSHSTGGSSGGAAAAVSSGMFPVAHASDGGGSIRIPASCCGLFGLKPTRGRVPLGPSTLEGWGGLSTTHVVSRTVRDSAALLDISAGPEPGSPYHAPHFPESFSSAAARQPNNLRIAICLDTFNGATVNKEVVALTQASAEKLESLGHRVDPISHSFDAELVRDSHGTLAISNIGAMLRSKEAILGRAITTEDVELTTWNNFQSSKALSAADYAQAVTQIHHNGQKLAAVFRNYDLILTPTMACLPPKLGELDTTSDDVESYLTLLYQMIGFTALLNDTGNPAASVPMAMSNDGLPVGCQLIADFGGEALLLSTSQQISDAGYFTKSLA